MNHLTIVHFPDPRLRQPAHPVKQFGTPELRGCIDEMVRVMRTLRGVGLAAPQVGVALQLAVIELKDGPLTMINPRLDEVVEQTEEDEEGCLSVPRVYGTVPRAGRLLLRAYDADGKRYEVHAAGLFARVVQHEYDHLQGGLFLDHCIRLTAGLKEARRFGLHIPPLA